MDRTKIVEELIACEQERCKALVAEDVTALRRLLAENLTHTHTRGNVDDLESYLAFLDGKVKLLDVSRTDDLQVKVVYSDLAIMSGTQVNLATLKGDPDKPAVRIESKVIQEWRNNGGQWQLVTFQSYPIGEPPPVID